MSKGFDRLQVSTAYQLVADAIERQIVSGQIKPGEHIGTEATLVRQFGVNRSTVREGIRLLEQSGLIRRDSRRRLCASLPRYNKLASRISRALMLHQVTFRELWEATMAIEPSSAEYAAQRKGLDQIEALEENLLRTEQNLGHPAVLAELDTEFHALVAKATGNRALMLAREPLGLLIYPTTEMLFERVPQAPERLIGAHRAIFEAIRKGDTAEAVLWMRRHVKDFKKGLEASGMGIDRPVERLYLDHVMQTEGKNR